MFTFLCVVAIVWLVLSALSSYALYRVKKDKVHMLQLKLEGKTYKTRHWTKLIDILAIIYIACYFCGVFK